MEHVSSIESTNRSPEGDEAAVTTEPISQAEYPGPESPPVTSTNVRHSTRERHPSFKLRQAALLARIRNSLEPQSYQEALNHAYSVHWIRAMKEEKDSLDENKTWDLVDEASILKSGKRIISCKWVYRLKRNADGSRHFKAHLVIKGNEQEYDIDFEETFAPVAKFSTICLLLALTA